MKSVNGFTFIGLTKNPAEMRKLHGNPSDWLIRHIFDSEDEASRWLMSMIKLPGYTGSNNNDGWKYGYSYSIPDV